jgi:excisionase family DNA binding protein
MYLNKEDFPAVLSVKEIQLILGIGRGQAYELVNSNQFHTVRVGKRILVSKDIFINWLEGNFEGNSEENEVA